MTSLRRAFEKIDPQITSWMAENGIAILRVSLGVIFFWFGFLKFYPDLSPAQRLAGDTIEVLTFGMVPSNVAVLLLAIWEALIGLGLITGIFLRGTLLLLWVQMLGTLTPLIIFPELTFTAIPYAPTLEGQYIIKNLVLISAGLVIGATVRGDRLSSESGTFLPR